jgi:hypothetical protein
MLIPSIKLGTKQKIIIVSISMLAISFVLVFFLLIPNINKVKNLYLDFSNQKTEVRGLIKSGATSLSLSKQIELLDNDLTNLQNSLLISGREIEFIQFLENLAREYNIEQDIDLNSAKISNNQPLFRSADLLLTAQGSFYNLLRYIVALEKNAYYININSISLFVDKEPVKATSFPDSKTLPNRTAFLNLSKIVEQDVVEQTKNLTLVAKINSKIFWQNDQHYSKSK